MLDSRSSISFSVSPRRLSRSSSTLRCRDIVSTSIDCSVMTTPLSTHPSTTPLSDEVVEDAAPFTIVVVVVVVVPAMTLADPGSFSAKVDLSGEEASEESSLFF